MTDILTPFWLAEEKRLAKQVSTLDPTSTEAMVTRAFWMGARHNLVRLQEMRDAWEWRQWPLYRELAQSIAREWRVTLT